ncbi:2382_t:CDS:1, partial [Gigaspora margarita]
KTVRNLDKEIIENKINDYLQTPLQPLQCISFSTESDKLSSLSSTLHSPISDRISSTLSISHSVISNEISSSMIETEKIHYNATVQKSFLINQKQAKN